MSAPSEALAVRPAVEDPAFAMVALPGSADWSVMSPVTVRSTGLPANLLEQLTWAAPVEDEKLFLEELHRTSEVIVRCTGLDVFREALAWQNPNVYAILDSYARTGRDPGRNSKKRQREYRLARYLARYCGKAETIGFFGPSGWATLTGAPGHVDQRPGDALVRSRYTVAEAWAVRRVGAALADDPQIAPWLPVRLRSHSTVLDGALHRPHAAPVPLSELERAILRRCDGERPRLRVIELVAGELGVERDVVAGLVADLIRRRCLVAGANLPLDPTAVAVLSRRIVAIGDAAARARAQEAAGQFVAAVRDLAEAAGDAQSVNEAQEALGEAYHAVVGTAANRRPGRMYAGRGIAYEDCRRDLDVDLGADFLARVSEGMRGVLTVAQWLTWRTATVYEDHFRRKWAGATHRLDTVFFEALRDLLGNRPKPMDDIMAEFRVRWGRLLAELDAPASGWRLDPDEFQAAAERLFPSPGPGWPAAAVNSPDLQLVPNTPGGVQTGDYLVVLGEIHVGTPTVTGPIFELGLGSDYPVSRYLQQHLGRSVVPMFPESWPRNTGRTMPTLSVPGDLCFAFADVDGAPPDTVPMTAIEVGVDGEDVFVALPDATRLAFTDFFSLFLSLTVIDVWKNISAEAYTPRISVGRFVLTREMWRVDIADQPFARKAGEYASYLAVDRWRRELGCPDRVYAKLQGEIKPFYVDFSSPILVLSFLSVLRGSLDKPNASTQLSLSEALPDPGQAWALDGVGDTYGAELRMAILSGVDPAAVTPSA